jgi:acyl-CoA thioesterase-1
MRQAAGTLPSNPELKQHPFSLKQQSKGNTMILGRYIKGQAKGRMPLAALALTFFSIATNPVQAKETMSQNSKLPGPLKNVHRIVTMGDSITQAGEQPGGYVSLLRTYFAVLYPDQHIEVMNAGISGHKSTDMEARFQKDVIAHSPDLVTISVGVNDVWHGYRDFARGIDHPNGELPAGVSVSLYREKVTAMIEEAQAAKEKVALLSPTLIYENLDSVENKKMMEYVDVMRDLAREHHCMFIDMNKPFRNAIGVYQRYAGKTTNLLTSDGVHMNPAGNKLMAYTILRGLGVPEKDILNLKP